MHHALHLVTLIFSWLVPKEFREPLMGDPAEAYSQRMRTMSSSDRAGLVLGTMLLLMIVSMAPSASGSAPAPSVFPSVRGVIFTTM